MSITGTKGVDISYAQGDIDLSKVKSASFGWVMIKCGQGGSSRIDDEYFEQNVAQAEKLGMPWGTYLLTEACSTAMIKDEVSKIDKFLKLQKTKGYRPTLPVALDIEKVSKLVDGGGWCGSNIANIADVFVDEIRALGYYPMIYTGYYQLRDWIKPSTLSKCDVWLAEYSRYPDYTEANLGMWQYCDGETDLVDFQPIVPNIGMKIDKDIAYKDYPTIIKNGGYNGWSGSSNAPTTTPTTTPDIIYRVRAGGRWYAEVRNDSDYAGVVGQPITDVAIKVTKGTVKYKVHVKGGSWLDWVTGYDINNGDTGYAGDAKPIDAVQIYYYTPTDVSSSVGYYRARYRVSPLGRGYFDYQYDTETDNSQDGYAGNYGTLLDRLQISLVK